MLFYVPKKNSSKNLQPKDLKGRRFSPSTPGRSPRAGVSLDTSDAPGGGGHRKKSRWNKGAPGDGMGWLESFQIMTPVVLERILFATKRLDLGCLGDNISENRSYSYS